MKCPKCGNAPVNKTYKVDYRTEEQWRVDQELNQQRRRHWCHACGHKWDTYEIMEDELLRLRRLAHHAVMAGVKLKRA